jgi:hypothetical protein
MSRKIDLNHIKSKLEEKGFVLISTEYKDKYTTLEAFCGKHGKFTTTWPTIRKKGYCCDKCFRESLSKLYKMTFIELQSRAKELGLALDEKSYNGKTVRGECKHDKHIYNVTNIINWHGCRYCGYERNGNASRTDLNELKINCENLGLELITTAYKDNKDSVIVKCKIHGLMPKPVSCITKGFGCKKCADEENAKKRRKPIEEVYSLVEALKYTTNLKDEDYVNSKTHFNATCKKHGTFPTTVGLLRQEIGCPRCHMGGTSKAEIELTDAVKLIIPEIKKARFKVNIPTKPYMKRFEADILNPKTNRAVEYDGEFQHSFQYMRKSKKKRFWSDDEIHNYHEIKDSFFLNYQGIEVLHIKQEDWKRDKQACIQLAIAFLAGKCSIYPKPLILPI